MSDRYRIAVVGSGPGGLSAACRAAEAGDSHILLEAEAHLANTIFRYQKGKHVMAEPGILPLRAAAEFEVGKRETILAAWDQAIARHQVNVRHGAEVTAIEKQASGFAITLGNGQSVQAEFVVMAIGMQGNIRKLGAPGEDLARVQYQLDDPDEYRKETIVVIGAGDAAIENAVALAPQNKVIIVNRRDEFSRAKDGNNALILEAIESEALSCYYNATVDRVDESKGDKPLTLRLNCRDGVLEVPCDRIIGRLGATPPRRFVESCGIEFPSDDPSSIPAVSARYESNVPGLYIIGALAGYPLIKQAMNQGYEVVEFIQGRPVAPADEPILRDKLAAFGEIDDLNVVLDVIKARTPWLGSLTSLQMREFLLESNIISPDDGWVIYNKADYSNSMFSVISGDVSVQIHADEPHKNPTIKTGRVFGEMGLISGRRRSATVVAGADCVLIEIPRRAMLKLIQSHAPVRRYIDRVFLSRALQTYLAPGVAENELAELLAGAELCSFNANEQIFAEGDEATAIHLVRSGSIMMSSKSDDHDVVLAYIPAGQYFGEIDVVAGTRRMQSATAAIKTETIRLPAKAFRKLLNANTELRESVRARFRDRIRQRLTMEQAPERGAMMQFLLREGLGEATDALLIDESLCIRCDQCERACAETHGRVSRLDREAGATFENLHVPTSCRHCEHPHCMKDCPPDAIHRAPNGEVYIEDTCIGCGNCERNCPYGVIQMGVQSSDYPSLWKWLLLGGKNRPGSENKAYPKDAIKKAVKCDMCRDRGDGPACVQACPTGAAIRIGPEKMFEVISRGG